MHPSPKNLSGGKIEKNEICGECSAYGERRSVYKVLVATH